MVEATGETASGTHFSASRDTCSHQASQPRSGGEHIPPRTVDMRQALRSQRRLSRSVKGSRSRIKNGKHLAKQHRRIQEQAIQPDFRLADLLVKAYDGIAVEKLNIAGLLRTELFSKQISQQRLGAFDFILEYKAVKAGVHYAEVNPRHTSTDCSRYGSSGANSVDYPYAEISTLRSTYAPGAIHGSGVGWDITSCCPSLL